MPACASREANLEGKKALAYQWDTPRPSMPFPFIAAQIYSYDSVSYHGNHSWIVGPQMVVWRQSQPEDIPNVHIVSPQVRTEKGLTNRVGLSAIRHQNTGNPSTSSMTSIQGRFTP